MRKRYHKKLRSCPLCKPEKAGIEKRWKSKELAAMREFERDMMNLAISRVLRTALIRHMI